VTTRVREGVVARGLRALGAVLVLFFAACADSAPPDFVLVLADDLGWADVGFQGSSFHRTPALDRLAADGLVFSRAYAAAPVCSPSRAALLTGLAPARLHLTDALGPRTRTAARPDADQDDPRPLREPIVETTLAADIPTLATRLAARGYETVWIGKWHLGGSPEEAGFERALAHSSAGAPTTYFSPYGLATLPDGPAGEYLTDRLTEEACRVLAEPRARPLLVVLSHYAPHVPLEAPPALVAEYQARADPAAGQRNPLYAAMIERLDASVGRLRAELEARDALARTLLLFTSDNGAVEELRMERKRRGESQDGEPYPITSNAPFRGAKGRLYEGGLRVPLVLLGGPLERLGRSDLPVVGTDLAPTLLALAGAEPLPVSDGLDLSAYLAGGAAPAPRPLAFHFPHQTFVSSLCVGTEKLIHPWLTGKNELYDLATDPGEAHDLSAERPERAAELERELQAWFDTVGASRPERRR
jgi:arylsulfatase A-like enzyme